MLINIKINDSGKREWALIELQGKIEPQSDTDLSDAQLAVGTMQLSNTVGCDSVCFKDC